MDPIGGLGKPSARMSISSSPTAFLSAALMPTKVRNVQRTGHFTADLPTELKNAESLEALAVSMGVSPDHLPQFDAAKTEFPLDADSHLLAELDPSDHEAFDDLALQDSLIEELFFNKNVCLVYSDYFS
ncbi:unnamed protein product [Protopolystoma xenopodis]|uniref:Uncharacterized protein n=1 Tax=Protopolystoma xenopodis TaxID=117903 RepID=A0A448XRR9_9PLAT|nr:unnamed protein product [Protopolystoma xenopodis]